MGIFNTVASDASNVINAASNIGGAIASGNIGGAVSGALNALNPNVLAPFQAARDALASYNKSVDATDTASIQNPFIIGSFLLTGMEIPTALDSIGGDQMVAVHNFPGGVRTVQSLGAFPPEKITWDGLFLGSNAWARAYALDRLRIDGALIDLIFGKWKWKGKIESFHVIIKHEWYATYHLEFIPTVDLSATPYTPNIDNATALLKQALDGISANTPTTLLGDLLPSTISGPLSSLLSVAQSALPAADGVLSLVDPSAVQQINTYAEAALSAGNAVVGATSAEGLTFSLASSVLHVMSYAGIIKNIYTSTTPLSQALSLINPDLPSLAAQVYGDASRWLDIGQANGINEPYPTGKFTIGIPASAPKTQNPGRFV